MEEISDKIQRKVYADMLHTCWYDLPVEKSQHFMNMVMDPTQLQNQIPLELFEKYIDLDIDGILKKNEFRLTKQEELLVMQAEILDDKFQLSMDEF